MFDDRSMEYLISRTLRIGVIVSSLFLIAGFIVAVAHPEFLSHPSVHPSAEYILSLFRDEFFPRLLDPLLLFYLGIFILLLTPILRVVIAVISFALQKDNAFTAISIAVLFVVLLSFYLSFSRI